MPVTERPASFGMDGPVMTGEWVNPKTGDKFTVKDSFFQDGQYVVQTTDGRLLGYNQIQSYVKMDKGTETSNSNSRSSLPPEVEALIGGSGPASNSQDILPEDMQIITGSAGVHSSSGVYANEVSDDSELVVARETPRENSSDFDFEQEMIIRALRNKLNIQIIPSVQWKTYPKKVIDTLVDIFNIDTNKIADYICGQIIDYTQIRESIKESITNYLDNSGAPDQISSPVSTNRRTSASKK